MVKAGGTSVVIFFFQAEDGIRDLTVTGVQTCALPIYLEIAWRIKTDNFGDRPEYKLEGTPLMVNGVLYATAGSRRAVIALDPATGELLWIHGEREGKRGGSAPRQLSGRGLPIGPTAKKSESCM